MKTRESMVSPQVRHRSHKTRQNNQRRQLGGGGLKRGLGPAKGKKLESTLYKGNLIQSSKDLLINLPTANVAKSKAGTWQHKQVGQHFMGLPAARHWPQAFTPCGPRNTGQPHTADSRWETFLKPSHRFPPWHIFPGGRCPWAAEPHGTGRNRALWAPTVCRLRRQGPELGGEGAEERLQFRLPENPLRAGGAETCSRRSQHVHQPSDAQASSTHVSVSRPSFNRCHRFINLELGRQHHRSGVIGNEKHRQALDGGW